MSGAWVKLSVEEAAPFAALSLRARGLHATLWRRQRDGVLDAAAHDLDSLAREIARRLGATAGDRRWIADELGNLKRAGYLVRRGESWMLVSSDERPVTPSRDERDSRTNVTRTEHERDANRTRTEHEPNTRSDASTRNDSIASALSPHPSLEREDKNREEGARAHEPAPTRTREGEPSGWWLDPWQTVNRLRERSKGKLSLTLNGHERELSRTLAALSAQRPRLADELDHWADLAGRDAATWWHGPWTIGALLGRPDDTGKRTADGLIRCLEETAQRMPKTPARVVPIAPRPVKPLTPEEQREADEVRARIIRERESRKAAEEQLRASEAARKAQASNE